MKDFLRLVKAVHANTLVVNQKKRNGKTIRPHAFSLSLLLVAFFLVYTCGIQFYNFFRDTDGAAKTIANYGNFILFFLSCYQLFSLFINTTFSTSIFFKSSNDCFMSLPIGGNRLFLAKMALSFYINVIYGGLTCLTIGIMSCILLQLPIQSYYLSILIFLLSSLTTPCISFLINNICAYFIDFRKKSKGTLILQIVFTLIGSIGLFSVAFINVAKGANMGQNTLDAANNYLTYFRWLSWISYLPERAIFLENNIDILCLFLYVGLSLILLLFTLFIAKKTYLSNLARTHGKSHKSLSKEKQRIYLEKNCHRLSNPNRILIRREFLNLRSVPEIFVNNYMFPVLMIISFSITLFTLRISGIFKEVDSIYRAMVCSFLCFSFYFHVIPFTSISLEGKNFAILKTLPLSTKNLIRYKFLPSIVYNYPLAILTSVLFFFFGTYSLDFLISVIVIGLFHPLCYMSFCFYIGICFPNLNYQDASSLMKKGWGPTLCHIGHYLLSGIATLILLFVSSIMDSLYIAAIILATMFILLSILFLSLSNRKLKELFNREISV
jgi:ABC-2 type transport system permease protein